MLRIPVKALPYIHYLNRLLPWQATLTSAAREVEILWPAEEDYPCKPAVFLPDQPAKIKGTHWSGSSIEDEMFVARTRVVTHQPTLAYHIEDAVLAGGVIYSGRLRYWVAHKDDRVQAETGLESAALVSTPGGARYFGHWLMDDCLTYEIAKNSEKIICIYNAFSDQMKKYQTYFRQDWTEIGPARIKTLTIFDDVGHNQYKRERQARLSEAVQRQFRTNRPLHVYLRRGRSGRQRLVVNEEEIIEALIKRGFVVADVEHDSLEHLLSILSSAETVVTLEGSHVAHCCFTLPMGAKVLLLQPANRFCMIHTGWLICIDATRGFVVGDEVDGGSFFPILDIFRTLDLMT